MAYPKKDPSKHSVNLGVSLPANIKARLTDLAHMEQKSLSRFVLEMAIQKLQKADQSLERKAKALKTKAQSAVNKSS